MTFEAQCDPAFAHLYNFISLHPPHLLPPQLLAEHPKVTPAFGPLLGNAWHILILSNKLSVTLSERPFQTPLPHLQSTSTYTSGHLCQVTLFSFLNSTYHNQKWSDLLAYIFISYLSNGVGAMALLFSAMSLMLGT